MLLSQHVLGNEMKRRNADQSEENLPLLARWGAWWRQPDTGLFAAGAILGPLALFLFTLAPTVTFEDSGELLTAAYHLGIPHPPGYPLWCITAHIFTWFPFGTVAQRVHVFDALCGAGTCLVVYLICRRLTADGWLSLGGAWILGSSRYLWSQSVIAEVYSLNALLTAVALYAAMEWAREQQSQSLYTVVIATGLGLANHYLFLLTCPPILLWVLVAGAREALRPGRVFLSLGLLVLCLSLYLYLPLRALADPPLNTGKPDNVPRFLAHVLRTAYSTGEEVLRLGTTLWDGVQHARDALVLHTTSLGWIVCAIGALGWATSLRSHRAYAIVTLAILLLNDVALNLLQRERYNAVWAFTHRVYHIPSDMVLATWCVLGLAWLQQALGGFRVRSDVAALASRLAVGSVVVALLTLNYPFASRRGDDSAERLGREFLETLPTNAQVTKFDDFVFVILYLTKVEQFRPDVEFFQPRSWADPKRAKGGLFSVVPWSDAAATYLSSFGFEGDAGTVPVGLGYQILPRAQAIHDPGNFRILAEPPATIPPPADPDNVHVNFARGMVANYYARFGARLFYSHQLPEAEAAFRTARDQASTAFSCYTVADVYAGLIRTLQERLGKAAADNEPATARDNRQKIDEFQQRRKDLLERALRLFGRYHDKATERFIPLRKDQIEQALAEVNSALGS